MIYIFIFAELELDFKMRKRPERDSKYDGREDDDSNAFRDFHAFSAKADIRLPSARRREAFRILNT